MSNQLTVIIPNFNGQRFLKTVLDSLYRQERSRFDILVVDNGSTDESVPFIKSHYPQVSVLTLEQNEGFASAVNHGIRACRTPYVLLLNNDTEAYPHFVYQLMRAMKRHKKAFSCQGCLLRFDSPGIVDSAGDLYNALGWSFSRGKGKDEKDYREEKKIFSSCAGAAIYRRDLLQRAGLFDDMFFAYREDLDIGYRAKLMGYENWYVPQARVKHVGSATTGSRHNAFKVRLSARNSVYVIIKNMPLPQIILNLPLLAAGFAVKAMFFLMKGLGKDYMAGLAEGIRTIPLLPKAGFSLKKLPAYGRVQLELWRNLISV